MIAWRISPVFLCLMALPSLAGCEGMEAAEGGVESTTRALSGTAEYFYLRCNATGWGADAATLTTATSQSGVYSLEYDVATDWMLTTGDQCVVTKTNSSHGWGTESVSYGANNAGAVVAPGQWSLGAVNSVPPTVRYPTFGHYRALVDWNNKTVSITLVSAAPAPLYYYLRCNATTWNVDGGSRLLPMANDTRLSLSYSVGQSWMVSGSDQCVVTRTNQMNGWGTAQSQLGTAVNTTMVVPVGGAASATLVSSGLQFGVKYPALGNYQAVFDPSNGQLRILVPGSDVPQTGLHGKVESLGGNRVRVTYDFATNDQLQDFVSTDSAISTVSLVNGRLVVGRVADSANTVAARLVKGFKADSIRYQAELLEGDHINVYLGTRWDGNWMPVRGYGMIHSPWGRFFVGNQARLDVPATSGPAQNVVYSGMVVATETSLAWTLDGNTQTFVHPYYGGTSRTIMLGGYNSTVAFDNVVLEGTVEGFETDGVATNPDLIHGNVTSLPDGRVRISYDFSDAQQKYDFLVANTSTRRELNDGRLIVSLIGDESPLKTVLLKYNMRIDRVTYSTELLAGDHINVYLNTHWDGNWAPALGCAAIHRNDGRIAVLDGTVVAMGDTAPATLNTPYAGEILVSSAGLSWTLNGVSVVSGGPCYSGLEGTVGLGSWGSDVAFDNLVFEGQVQ